MFHRINNAPLNTEALQTEKSSSSDIANFVKTTKQLSATQQPRLIFAMDATMSCQPTWDLACDIQSSMFKSISKNKGMSIQLVFYRGHGECKSSNWVATPQALHSLMSGVECLGGKTQISKVLSHAQRETQKKKVSILIFIGDAMEEDIDTLCDQAGKLGAYGVKAFMFQEGYDSTTEKAFRQIATLTSGAYMRLNPDSASELEALLSAAAAYASGGLKGLEAIQGQVATDLLVQLKK